MSESEVSQTVVAQVEADPIEPNNRIADLLAAIEGEKHNDAEKLFTDLLQDRLSDAIDQKKISVAQDIYGMGEQEPESTDEDELTVEAEPDHVDDQEVEAELETEEEDDVETSETEN